MAGIDVEAARRRLEENFAPWVRDLGLVIEAISPEETRLRLPFGAHLARVGGILSGQALIAAADTTMVFAVVAAMGGEFRPVATIDLTINYMRPVAVDVLLVARVLRVGRTVAFATTEIREAESGKVCAFATGTFAPPAPGT